MKPQPFSQGGKIEKFDTGDLTKERLNQLVDAINALQGLKITTEGSTDGQAYARLDKIAAGWNLALYPARMGGGELRTFRVCGLEGPELVQIRVIPVPPTP